MSVSQTVTKKGFERALGAFLTITIVPGEELRALRALALHMLQGHAPQRFEQAKLADTFSSALTALTELPAQFPLDLPPETAMARIDGCYLRHLHGLPINRPEERELAAYLHQLAEQGDLIYAWLLGELALEFGVDVRLRLGLRPLKGSRVHDLYWLTHQFLLATRYLHSPLPGLGFKSRADELAAATAWIVEQKFVDLGAEVAVCLQLTGRRECRETQALVDLILGHQCKDGSVVDPSMEQHDNNIAHTTAAAMLALAGRCRPPT